MKSIEQRIRYSGIGIVLLTLLAALSSMLIVNNSMEDVALVSDMQREREFLLSKVGPESTFTWRTATVHGFWVPAEQQAEADIPDFFNQMPFPYSGEKNVNGLNYVVNNIEVPGGRLYLAKDNSLHENNEELFKRMIAAMSLVMVVLAIILVQLTIRQLIAPLTLLTREIEKMEPAATMARLSEQDVDKELQVVAKSFNRFLDEIESYVKREKTLLGMASHELRTPISIISGAMDGIESRGNTSLTDIKAMRRIRRAVDEMDASVEAILKLTKYGDQTMTPVPVRAIVMEVLEETGDAHKARERVRVICNAEPVVTSDPVLLKMLVRNLLNNALQHTTGSVNIRVENEWMEVNDEGTGLPQDSRAFLTTGIKRGGMPASGLGLFIATLICERLRWRLLDLDNPAVEGTKLRLMFMK
ncbi:sensor histidine kinase [Halotalea alkalilenta]|uniref:sensor histidine kinase n=1 Tax=Halotalea alkalilenta TaxID=376489 RepID=UPI0004832667|nr:HAMP domain-containing sensor histidine kinase [Halotalea alkalilenta]